MKHTLLAVAAAVFAAVPFGAQGHGHGHQPPLKSAAVETLKKGDFAKASELLAAENKANPGEPRLTQIYAGLKSQLRREKLFEQENDPGMIVLIGKEMRKFYNTYGLYAKSVPVDRKIYAAAPTFQNGVALGVTLLNAEMNEEAARIFGKLDLSKAQPGPALCGALAFARVGKKAESEKLTARFDASKLDSNCLGLRARCAARNGDAEKAAALAARILESTPASRHGSIKRHLFGSADFKKVAADAKFQAALKTASKVKDGCANCPNHGTDKCDHKH